jgi:hypothetical protein
MTFGHTYVRLSAARGLRGRAGDPQSGGGRGGSPLHVPLLLICLLSLVRFRVVTRLASALTSQP